MHRTHVRGPVPTAFASVSGGPGCMLHAVCCMLGVGFLGSSAHGMRPAMGAGKIA